MYTGRSWALGLVYLTPVLLFVAIFTAYPLVQMVWMSFHNWSLIEPKKWVGFANFAKAWHDRQFWISLGFTLKYTLYITPILGRHRCRPSCDPGSQSSGSGRP
jgi:multiple sugar transport system permease protein